MTDFGTTSCPNLAALEGYQGEMQRRRIYYLLKHGEEPLRPTPTDMEVAETVRVLCEAASHARAAMEGPGDTVTAICAKVRELVATIGAQREKPQVDPSGE